MTNSALSAFAVSEYFAKVESLAKFAIGEVVTFHSGCTHAFEGAEAVIVKVDLDHTHGGSVATPWWERHTQSCFNRKHLMYSLAINPRADGSADWRWQARESEIIGRKSPGIRLTPGEDGEMAARADNARPHDDAVFLRGTEED